MNDPDRGSHFDAMAYWDEVIADMERLAADFEDDGWRTLQLHPGNVTPLPGRNTDHVGFDVLIPDNEYDVVVDWLGDGIALDDYQVYRESSEGIVYLLVVMQDAAREAAVLYPIYYRTADAPVVGMLEQAEEVGRVDVRLRRLDGEYVAFTYDDPALFAPE